MSVAELRRILNHNATDPNAVDQEIVDVQLRTAAALSERLDQHGGVILGDEVGAGKTFVTFAVLADRLLREPRRGAVIFVPNNPLQHKWADQLRDYLHQAVKDRAAGEALAKRVHIIDRWLDVYDEKGRRRPRSNDIVIAQHRIFSGQTSNADRALCLERWLELRCTAPRKPWSRLFKACGQRREEADDSRTTWSSTDVLTSAVLKPIDAVFAEYESGRRDLQQSLQDAVQIVRREVGRKVLPDAALVVVDEAHNLRSTQSQVYKNLMYVLQGRFDAMLFLTATPFQLGRDELHNIVSFFRTSRGASTASTASFDARVAEMDAGMNAYVGALAGFGAAWRDLEPSELDIAEALVDQARDDGCAYPVRAVAAAAAFEAACAAHAKLEAGLRPFIVRSIRPRHHVERCGTTATPSDSRVPMALVDRLISERLASRDRPFVASALTSACSSWDSLFTASITNDDRTDHTLTALRTMKSRDVLGPHPKMEDTIERCLSAAAEGEKTLIFVERFETGQALRDQLSERLHDGRSTTGRARLQTPTRFGWPSLRENYLHTIYPLVFDAAPSPAECVSAMNEPAMLELWDRVDLDGPLNYKVIKRLVEHAVFRRAAAATPSWTKALSDRKQLRACVENLLDQDYVVNGLDLLSGETNERQHVPTARTRTSERDVNPAFVEAYATYLSPWASSDELLAELAPRPRADLIDAAAAAIASSHLQVEVMEHEADGDPARHFASMTALLLDEDGPWQARFKAIAQQAVDLAAGDRGDGEDRIADLVDALRRGDRVQFVSGATKNETKVRAIAGFNTPLYPEILIATGVLGEGVDLHRSARRVIHHDLPWNPAKLEQRTGRVDRIGSLSSRLETTYGANDARSAVDIGLPFVRGTYDETIFNRVLARRREFRCLLGNRPEWDDDTVDADVPNALPESFVTRLQVQLGPK